jgi:hypothetical protein
VISSSFRYFISYIDITNVALKACPRDPVAWQGYLKIPGITVFSENERYL